MKAPYILQNWIKENKHGYWVDVGKGTAPLRMILRSAVIKTKKDGIARRIIDPEYGKLAAAKLGYDGKMVIILTLRGLQILTRSYYRAGTLKGRYESGGQDED